MEKLDALHALILHTAANGMSATDLRAKVAQAYPEIMDGEFQSAVLGLQEKDRLIGQEVSGEWVLSAIDKTAPDYPHPEYSPQFAEMIIAASCGDMVEIDPDDLIAQLDAMLANARAKKPHSKR